MKGDLFFSVIIPTRNRPELLSRAAETILNQTAKELEIIVVCDGANRENKEKYKEIVKKDRERIHIVFLEKTMGGHGPSFARNRGIEKARGEYICFCDDDDFWVDDHHLERAKKAIKQSKEAVDLYISSQKAYFKETGEIKKLDLWLGGLREDVLNSKVGSILGDGVFRLPIHKLCSYQGFAHLNCLIARKEVLNQVGLFEEAIRFEEDFHLYTKLTDAAENVLYTPKMIAQHNVPDREKKESASTVSTRRDKLLTRVRICNDLLCKIKRDTARKKIKRYKIGALKELAEKSYKNNPKEALFYAKEVSMGGFNVKWLLFWVYIWACKAFKR